MGKYVYGIDLGTTYSCVAYLDENGKAVTCKNKLGETTTPSVVQIREGMEPLVGKPAKDTAMFEPDNTLAFVKNFIGRRDETTGEFIKLTYGKEGKEISPVDISAEILKTLAKEAGEYLEDTVEDVVITCPAYFSTERREATEEAGRRAGLNVLKIIEEPTAAALAYGVLKEMKDKTILVYDLGGGTFDVTVMRVNGDGTYTVLCTEGDHDLGGGKWDSVIYDYVYQEWEVKNEPSGEMDVEAQQDLSIRCEDAKKGLTNLDVYTIGVNAEEGRAKVEISREFFEEMTKELLDSTINLTKKAIAKVQGFLTEKDATGATVEKGMSQILSEFDEKFDHSQIDKILLVGGSTLMPQVKRAVEENFEIETVSFVPHEAVAHGAAIFSGLSCDEVIQRSETGSEKEGNSANDVGNLTFGTGSILPQGITFGSDMNIDELIQTISAKSYGIHVFRDGEPVVMNMIKKGTALPANYSAMIPLKEANMATCDVKLYEADTYNDFYGIDEVSPFYEKSISLTPNLPAGTPVELVTSVDKQGLFKINVKVAGEELDDDFTIKFE